MQITDPMTAAIHCSILAKVDDSTSDTQINTDLGTVIFFSSL